MRKYYAKSFQRTKYLYLVETSYKIDKHIETRFNYYGSSKKLSENDILNIAQKSYLEDYKIGSLQSLIKQNVKALYTGYKI